MTTTLAMLFDDGRGLLSPLTDLRPVFHIRTGALTTAERLTRAFNLDIIGVCVPAPLAELAAEQHSVPVNQVPQGDDADPVLLINGRCPLPLELFDDLAVGQVAVEQESGDMVAVRLTRSGARELLGGGEPGMESLEIEDKVLLSRPWDWAHFLDQCLAFDLSLLMQMDGLEQAPDGVTAFGEHPVCIHPSAKVMPGVILDATNGPIVIDENATVRPRATIIGPAYVGAGSTVLDAALIKGKTAIGPVCKVAGEVGGTIFQGYANKTHDGHLGDSWVGEWVNLGAGTTNSNLLNTYAEVTASPPGGKREKTGLTFLGCVLGDHTKTAIGTRIMTGAITGTGVMHAASTPLAGTVDAFAWQTDAGAKPYRLGKFVEVAAAMMQRRGVEQSQAYSRRLTILHEQATGQDSGMSWSGKDESHLMKSK